MKKAALLSCLLLALCFSSVSAQLFQPYRQYAPRRQYAPQNQTYRPQYPQQQYNPYRQQLQNPYRQQQQRNPYPGRQVIIQPNKPPTRAEQLEHQRKERERAARAQRRQKEMEAKGQSKTLFPRMAGEFEKQRAIMLSICDWQPQHYSILRDLVDKTAGYARVVICYDDNKQLASALKVIAKNGKQYTHLDFLELDLDTIWLRDFGPRLAEGDNGTPMSIDFYYDGTRPKDDQFPESWTRLTNAELNHVPWTLQGGNLISNGKGLALATSRIFEDNRVNFPAASGQDPVAEQEKFVARQFKLFCNIKELVILQPLENESTRHIDMFATLLAPDLALVAQVDPRYDPLNARILNQNARKLSQVKVDGKPMRVERITVPPRQGKYWSPYTNIILTDKLVLMPTFKSDPPAYVRQAVNVYRKLLPNHHIATIDMTTMNKLEGSLHCLSCNVPEFAQLPKGLISYSEAQQRFAQLVKAAPKWVVPDPAPGIVLPGKQIAETSFKRPKAANGKSADNYEREEFASGSEPKVPTNQFEESTASPGATATSKPDLDKQLQIERARRAVQTYRRKFRSSTGEQEIDAFVVSVSQRTITILRSDDKTELQVRLNYLHPEDRDWLARNRQQINDNGRRVKDFLLNFDN